MFIFPKKWFIIKDDTDLLKLIITIILYIIYYLSNIFYILYTTSNYAYVAMSHIILLPITAQMCKTQILKYLTSHQVSHKNLVEYFFLV